MLFSSQISDYTDEELTIKMKMFKKILIREGLTSSQANTLITHTRFCQLLSGSTIFNEGAPGDKIIWILEGEVEVIKYAEGEDDVIVHHLSKGDVAGDMAFLAGGKHKAKYSATLRTSQTSSLAVIAIDIFEKQTELEAIYNSLILHFARLNAQRLATTSNLYTQHYTNALQRQRMFARYLAILLLLYSAFTLSAYSLRELTQWTEQNLGINEFLFRGLFAYMITLILALGLWAGVRNLKLSSQELGLSLKQWPHQLLIGVFWSIPIFIGCIIARMVLYPDDNPLSIYALTPSSGYYATDWVTLLMFFFYVFISCPLQEFIARVTIQSPILQAFGTGQQRTGMMISLITSGVSFGVFHLMYGYSIVLLTTLAGFYWGGMFLVNRSLLAVSFSHTLTGIITFYWMGLIR